MSIHLSSSFGKQTIKLRDGSKVYAVLESWGLNSDRVSLTRDPDTCKTANPETDYIDIEQNGDALIYQVTDKGLVIFADQQSQFHEPLRPWSQERPSVVIARDPSWGDMYHDPARYHVSRINIPLNQVCLINFFRKASSLRPGARGSGRAVRP